MTDRLNQPRCGNERDGKMCNHPLSFHATRGEKRLGACKALGCKCQRWAPPIKVVSKSS